MKKWSYSQRRTDKDTAKKANIGRICSMQRLSIVTHKLNMQKNLKFLSMLAAYLWILLVSLATADARRSQQSGCSAADCIDHNDDGVNILIEGDMVVRKSSTPHRLLTGTNIASSILSRIDENTSPLSNGRRDFWETTWSNFNAAKNVDGLWDVSTSGRPTLDKSHLIVLPIWWDGAIQGPTFNRTECNQILEKNRNYYLEMSWNKHDITWEFWDRIVLTGVTSSMADFNNTKNVTRTYVASKNYVEFVNYTGIVFLHDLTSQSPFNFSGGWGTVNGK